MAINFYSRRFPLCCLWFDLLCFKSMPCVSLCHRQTQLFSLLFFEPHVLVEYCIPIKHLTLRLSLSINKRIEFDDEKWKLTPDILRSESNYFDSLHNRTSRLGRFGICFMFKSNFVASNQQQKVFTEHYNKIIQHYDNFFCDRVRK